MCNGESSRPSFGGTIAVLFPRETPNFNASPQQSLSSSPSSVASYASSSLSMSSYSLFFRDTDTDRKTKAVFRMDDTDTYQTLRGCRQVDMRIEKYGDLTTSAPATPPLHQFQLDMSQDQSQSRGSQTEMEFELPERLDLGVSEKGIVGRQVTVREAGGAVLGVGVVGYN
ncbi:hypothetical protein NUU61_006250 [Penicillium alfredii]|uniref:Uncharacterized protein n=1 Tax=Penicillium alfredii TaxID=1506179 RepID=A0A9W9K3G1_9EURO|nr:uncharacterized protein NUU61_006250 [Penicillium alfredii]KAJ5091380.1 hypothetical protein NUU61_006250 [Penicillium alfredii]